MRLALIAAISLSSPAFAETFTVRSAPNTVTVYAQGAKVTRVLSVDLPAGAHEVVLPDLPAEFFTELFQVSVSGAVLGPVTARQTKLPPLIDPDADAIVAAREEVKSRQAALDGHLDEEAEIRVQVESARAQIAFLENLGQHDGLTFDLSNLTELTAAIGSEISQAHRQILNAEQTIRAMSDTRAELKDDLQHAEEALAALMTPVDARTQAVVTVSTDVDSTAELVVTYFVPAEWQPISDPSLVLADPAQLSIKRSALVSQTSGEDWQNIALTLSTLKFGGSVAPSSIWPRKLRISEPVQPKLTVSGAVSIEDRMVKSPVLVEEQTSAALFDGYGVSYVFPNPVSVANGVDAVRVASDTLTFDTEVFARAVPFKDETAFLMARFHNTSPEPFLQTDIALFSVDGSFIGAGEMPYIPSGGEAVLGFGPVENLRLDRVVLDLNEGDRGLISRSNTRDEEVRIEIENLGEKSWPVELLDRVPHSDQEGLVVAFSATPQPDQQNFEDQRGILQWEFDLPPGAEKSISLTKNVRWPEGMVLR